MLSRMLGPLSVLCLGVVVMFVFFAALGAVSPVEVIWLTDRGRRCWRCCSRIRSLLIRHELGDARQPEHVPGGELACRERRGF